MPVEKLTPMMQQYKEVKGRYKDSLLLFRLGDFYEMFFEDASLAARELEITLTGRDCGLEGRAPMCGFPYHAAQSYISKLIKKGYKVAICEQLEDTALAKGIVKRDVTRVITPGTVIEQGMLEEKRNNFLMSIYANSGCYGLAVTDVSTGECYATQIAWGNTERRAMDELARYKPIELIVSPGWNDAKNTALREAVFAQMQVQPTVIFPFAEQADFVAEHIALHPADFPPEWELAQKATGMLFGYLNENLKTPLASISSIVCYKQETTLSLDHATRRNLELTETLRDGRKRGSLLWVIDHSSTSMGGRMLRKWLEQPLLDIAEIEARLNAVSELKESYALRKEIIEHLKEVYDLERLAVRCGSGAANARDLLSVAASAEKLPVLLSELKDTKCQTLQKLTLEIGDLSELMVMINGSISTSAPLGLKEGGIIKDGYNDSIDELRRVRSEGKDWIAELEVKEKERSGIRSLKIRYNDNFGYYIEITKANAAQVPEDYVRKQTLVNCERFSTPELKRLEGIILGADQRVLQLEYEMFCAIRDKVASRSAEIQRTALGIARLDALLALAETAENENYCRPKLNNDGLTRIEGGRHPVVEKLLKDGLFVPNDTRLDLDENRTLILTGPNMAGKSTYMRQVALTSILAQMGSFVPATSAEIGIADRIFTRVGASDDLSGGLSTFMVEMTEVANILNQATSRSLLILDEIGRGTSTYDGLAIAWAVTEAVNDRVRLGARTLFATHYHELTELENRLHGVKNYRVSVRRKGEDVIFLHKIVQGGADESYGIEVARLAGVPDSVIQRARVILEELDEADILKKGGKRKRYLQTEGQLDLAASAVLSKAEQEVLSIIRAFDPSSTTPLEALNHLYRLSQKLK